MARTNRRESSFVFGHRLCYRNAPDKTFVLSPWRLFKNLSTKDDTQIVQLMDGSEYKGRMRTILADDRNRRFELSGATTFTIVQSPDQLDQITSNPATTRSDLLRWRITFGKSKKSVVVTSPQFVYSMFRVTSGGGFYVEQGHYETMLSERFGVTPAENFGWGDGRREAITSSINDFERIKLGVDRGMPVTVKVKNAKEVVGILAATPLGLDALSNVYLNRPFELAGRLPNGDTILFSVFRKSDGPLVLERLP